MSKNNSIRIDTGSIRLTINDDPSRVIEFNPNDVVFIERFYGLISKFEEEQKQYAMRLKELQACEDVDSYGIPKNLGAGLKLLTDVCVFMRENIDTVFGEGTSNVAFGNANTLDMFEQFLSGVAPYIKENRESKIEKYTGNRAQRRAASKVMK